MSKFIATLTTTALFLSISSLLQAEIRLPRLVSDNMVIQRDTQVKVWGWAHSGEKITLEFKKQKFTTTSVNSKWSVLIPTSKAGGPYKMEIIGDGSEITLNNIMVGDIWFCAGQSNMVHNIGLHKDEYVKEIETINYPEIRQFLVPTLPVLTEPLNDVSDGNWEAANPENIESFSVVAFFFAKELYDHYHIPIGLINASVGGTPIEAWIGEEGLNTFPEILHKIRQNKDTTFVNYINKEAEANDLIFYNRPTADKGLTGSLPWYEPAYMPTNWKSINIPGYWEDQGIKNLDGTVWYRKEIEVPTSMIGVPVRINMGRIVDADKIYINGQLVGEKTYMYPQRRYDFGADILKSGKNTIVIQVTNYGGKGGFVPDKPYFLAVAGDTLDLKGEWQYCVGEVFSSRPRVNSINIQNQPTTLFNGMVAPFVDFPVKGFIWYQGESNTGNSDLYAQLQPALIADWRKKWHQSDLPFFYVQLPNFMDVNYLPEESQWAALRNAQLQTLKVPNTAMVVTLNLGEWNDIHPEHKEKIGHRLALAARKQTYLEKGLVYSGPLYKSFTIDGNKVTLQFDHIGSGLIAKDGEPIKWLAIAGEDKRFVWAQSEIKDNMVVLWNSKITNPAYVRYAWMDNPNEANLYNKEGLPASPFEVKLMDFNQQWRGKKATVVLTFDDALEVHLDKVIPLLDSLGFKGSFYLSGAYPGSYKRINDWKKAAANGHELGNHTLYHPCKGEGKNWITPPNDLNDYSTAQIVREIDMMNIFLQSLDGKTERTFAFTCGDTATGEGSFINAIKDKFISMRGVNGSLNYLKTVNLQNFNAYGVVNNNADQMISWAEKAKEESALLVILFHGVGGEHTLNIDLDKFKYFLIYLKENEKDLWITTALDASKHILEQKTRQK